MAVRAMAGSPDHGTLPKQGQDENAVPLPDHEGRHSARAGP